jgi:hemerythrin-like domain-containing protein
MAAMRLIEELRSEHEVIERAVGALGTYVELRARGGGTPADGEGFLRFFRLFAGSYHHAREEDTLFPALEKHVELPHRSGPLFSLTDQHRRMEATFDEMAPLLAEGLRTKEEGETLVELFTRYSHALLVHIDAENSVLLPESEERLRQSGVHELDGRLPTKEELDARAEGERLVDLYPPSTDLGPIRGEGCVICPSYGTTCGGLEREWWNDSEWERFSKGRE